MSCTFFSTVRVMFRVRVRVFGMHVRSTDRVRVRVRFRVMVMVMVRVRVCVCVCYMSPDQEGMPKLRGGVGYNISADLTWFQPRTVANPSLDSG